MLFVTYLWDDPRIYKSEALPSTTGVGTGKGEGTLTFFV